MIRLLIVSLVSPLLAACVSSSEDYVIAAAVGKYLDATGVVPSDTREADRTHSGTIVYFSPGIKSPHFTYYEVTDSADMLKLKAAAEAALKDVPAARKITLHFMEKQVFHQSKDGSGYRGHEKEIKTIVVQREG